MDIGAIGRMLDMARAQQSLEECNQCDVDPSQKAREELKRQADLAAAGGDDKRPIPF